MKKSVYISLISMFIIILGFLISPSVAYALPFETETSGPNGDLVPTQQVYVPKEKIVLPQIENFNSQLNRPSDMVYDEFTNSIFVADSGNKRVVKMSLDDGSAIEILETKVPEKSKNLANPTGLAINSEYLVVADQGIGELIVYNKDTLDFVTYISKETFSNEDQILIGKKSNFKPLKTAIDNRGNIYVVNEGETKGVMQFNIEGKFAGYIGANKTSTSFLDWIQNLFGINNDDELNASGQSISNVAIDSKGLVYTVTENSDDNAIKKLNTTGVAIMSPSLNLENTTQICIDNSGNIYSVQRDGYITIFDSYGSLLFKFGGKGNEEILGSLNVPAAINVTNNKEILVLDQGNNMIVYYEPTHFAKVVYEAVDYYKEGLYLEGKESWLQVLKYNNKFILAYKALAKASMKEGKYDLALTQFKLAEDKAGYSEAYWNIRDMWLRDNLIWIILPIVIIVIGYSLLRLVDRKKPALFASSKNFVRKVNDVKIIGDTLYCFKFLKHPKDAIYEIKYKGKTSVISATIFYLLFVIIQIVQIYLKGYLFNNATVYDSNGLQIILMSTLPIFLLIICNYFVSNVTDGEGKFKQVYSSFIYALTPYLIFAIPLFIISNFLTYNEQVIYDFLNLVIYGWCAINIILTIMELHDYTFWKAILNIILTLVCFILVIAFAFILYMLGYQLITYLIDVFKELTA